MRKQLHLPILSLLFLAIFVAGIFVGVGAWENASVRDSLRIAQGGSAANFQQLREAWDLLQQKYIVQPIDPAAATRGAIRGLVESLGDPYTVFFDPQEAQEFREEIDGTFEGIGAEIGIKDDALVIIAPLPQSPAERAGLLPGDQILLIDEAPTTEMNLDEAVRKIRGEKGSAVVLTIRRTSEQVAREVAITRDAITVQSVRLTTREDGLASVQVAYFGPKTVAEFREIANALVVQKKKGMLLDLRSNPGGFLDAAVDVASFFVQKDGVVVVEKFRDDSTKEYRSDRVPLLQDMSLVILVDQGSASAAEIVAGALQDYQIGTVVGTGTFGKGSVQEVETLDDGSSIKVTVARWFTPKGRTIDATGIQPDITVERSEEDIAANRDPQLDRAAQELLQRIGQ